MITREGHKPILHLPRANYPEPGDELFCQRRISEAADVTSKRVIPALNLIVNISPAVEPEVPLPAPWDLTDEPLYFLSPATTQPVVWNGFVWSSYGDGTRHRLQHFVEGQDILGGRPLHVYFGVVNMYNTDGSLVVCRYRRGHCISVSHRTVLESKRLNH